MTESVSVRALDLSDRPPGIDMAAVSTAFGNAKPDSIVARLPPSLHADYFRAIMENGGYVLLAFDGDVIAGFLIFVRDNNLTLAFLRRHKLALARHLLFSGRLSDKVLLLRSAANAFFVRGTGLSHEFDNEISLLAVLNGHQRKGVGRRLVEGIRERAGPLLNVKTDLDNHDANRFYESCGFRRAKQISIGLRKLVCYESVPAAQPDRSRTGERTGDHVP